MSDIPPDIAAILAYNETGAQFFKRVQQERVLTGLPIIDNNLSLRPGVVLEVSGPPGSGKTELLLSIALHVLLSPYADPNAWTAAHLPPQQQQQQQQQPQQPWQQQHPQGPTAPGHQLVAPPAAAASCPVNSGSVVIFDLDGKFDGVRLMQVLEPQVHSAWRDQQQQRQAVRAHSRGPGGGGGRDGAGGGTGPGPPPHPAAAEEPGPATLSSQRPEPPMLSPDQVVEEVLSRLHLVRCDSSLQLLAALAGLPARLEGLRAAGSPCRLLLVDNVGAHYWRDRAARNLGPQGGAYPAHPHPPAHPQQQQQHQHQHQPPLALSLFEIHAAIAARLAHLSRRQRLPVVATKTAAVTAKGPQGGEGEAAAGPGGEGEVQLQQREFMPMPWQNVVTHRLLLLPRGVVPGPPAAAATAAAGGTQQQHHHHPALQSLTSILAELLVSAGSVAAGEAAGAVGGSSGAAAVLGGSGVGSGVGGGIAGSAGGRTLAQLLISAVAMVEQW